MRRFFKFLCFLGWVAATWGCATGGSGWVPLSPNDHYAYDDVHKAEKTVRGVTVTAKLLQGKTRYQARIEIRNGSAKRAAHGPEDVVLQDGSGLVQPPISADDIKREIRRYATSQAAYSLDSWPSYYYYAPRRVYYGRGRYRYRYGYVGPFYHDDYLERRMDAERILDQADKKIASVDADYLHSQEIPAGGSTTGFVHFAKKPEKGTPAGPLKLSLTVEKRVFVFEFSPRP